jgi:hypothetical protein
MRTSEALKDDEAPGTAQTSLDLVSRPESRINERSHGRVWLVALSRGPDCSVQATHPTHDPRLVMPADASAQEKDRAPEHPYRWTDNVEPEA